MVNGKDKGNAFENKVLRMFRAIGADANPTVGSGSGFDEIADIDVNLGSHTRLIVECKHYKRVTRGLLEKWWDKVSSACYKKTVESDILYHPLIVFRENGHDIFAVTKHEEYDIFQILFFNDFLDVLEANLKSGGL